MRFVLCLIFFLLLGVTNGQQAVKLSDEERTELAKENMAKAIARTKVKQAQYEKKARQDSIINNKKLGFLIKSGTTLPRLPRLDHILRMIPEEGNSRSNSDKFIQLAEEMGYKLNNSGGKLYADFNHFIDKNGRKIETVMTESINGGTIKMVYLEFPKAPKEVIILYVEELNNGYRDRRKPRAEIHLHAYADSNYTSPYFVDTGETIYFYEVKAGNFRFTLIDNRNAAAAILTERIHPNTLLVNSWSNGTDIKLEKGNEIKFSVDGIVKIDDKFGYCNADGSNLKGGPASNLPTGALIGRIEEGEWFLVGSSNTILVEKGGRLQLRINDHYPSDNYGELRVTYEISKTSSLK